MASFGPNDIVPGRVLSEDDDWMILEIPKNDQAAFTVRQDPVTGQSFGEDEFYTVLFVQFNDGQPQFKKPWELRS